MKKFRDFESAREFARSLGLQSTKEWRAYTKSGDKPDDIPNSPDSTYKKNFKGYGDWLGTGTPSSRNRKYRSFEEARKFVRKLNLKNAHEWRAYCISGNKPYEITSVPERVYKNNGWIGLGDWLGTGTPSSRNRKYRSFEDAKEFVHKLKLKSTTEWNEYCKSGNKPDDIPQSLRNTYKNKYKGMGDWLGTGRIADQKKVFRSFEDSKKFAQSLKLKNVKEWETYNKSGNRPMDIHVNPSIKYKNKGWINWSDFLGTKNISNIKSSQNFLSFEDARKFVHTLKIKDQNEWANYCNSGNRPENIPSNPTQVYKNKGWVSFGDWTGTGSIASINRDYRPFKEAREFVRSLGLKNNREWKEYCKSGNKPDDIPSAPWNTYKEWNIKRRLEKK
jgi:hypothetical protein